MEFIVIVNNKEYGPVDSATLELWIEEGRILADTLLKDAENGDIYIAGSIDFLSDAFINQADNFKQSSVYKIKQRKQQKNEISIKADTGIDLLWDRSTEVNYFIRIKAAILDIILLLACNFFLLTGLILIFSKMSMDVNLIFQIYFVIFTFICIFYYSFYIGYYNRTLGMKLFGIKIIRYSDRTKKVYLLRAFVYTLLMYLFFIVNIILVFITGTNRVFQDYLTDIVVISDN